MGICRGARRDPAALPERVIRDEAEWHNARQYIVDNPLRWAEDTENPANRIKETP